jgi:RNA:NAD 2'-phosphotransferase (TPT1/KptA family)
MIKSDKDVMVRLKFNAWKKLKAMSILLKKEYSEVIEKIIDSYVNENLDEKQRYVFNTLLEIIEDKKNND